MGWEQLLQSVCHEDGFYQVRVGSLLSSMSACHYLHVSGLNDTLTFQTDSSRQNLVGVSIDYKDIKHAASLEKNPRKRRIMQEKQFNQFSGSASLKTVDLG